MTQASPEQRHKNDTVLSLLSSEAQIGLLLPLDGSGG